MNAIFSILLNFIWSLIVWTIHFSCQSVGVNLADNKSATTLAAKCKRQITKLVPKIVLSHQSSLPHYQFLKWFLKLQNINQVRPFV